MKESLKKLEEELSKLTLGCCGLSVHFYHNFVFIFFPGDVPYEKPEQSSKDNEIEIVHCENESKWVLFLFKKINLHSL